MMSSETEDNTVSVSQKELNFLVTNIIPTSKYFELRFDNMHDQISDLKEGQKEIYQELDKRFDQVGKRFEQVNEAQKEIHQEIDKRFEQVDKRFGQVDKRFEQVDKRFEQVNEAQKEIRQEMGKRFEQVDKRFEQVNAKLDQIMDRVDVKIDGGLREGRLLTVKLFSFAMVFSAISMAGLLAKMTGLF